MCFRIISNASSTSGPDLRDHWRLKEDDRIGSLGEGVGVFQLRIHSRIAGLHDGRIG